MRRLDRWMDGWMDGKDGGEVKDRSMVLTGNE